jgi:hypothetical protein
MSQSLNSAVAVIGIDICKNSFHIVGLDSRGAIVLRQKWSRGQVEARLANMPPCLIGMEACVGAHHLSRKLKALGHDARLMPAKYVRPYSKGQKNDFRDAEAIAEAVQRPTMKFVATKTVDQLDLQRPHATQQSAQKEKPPKLRRFLRNPIRFFDQVASAAAFRFVHRASSPTAPSPAAKSERAAGRGDRMSFGIGRKRQTFGVKYTSATKYSLLYRRKVQDQIEQAEGAAGAACIEYVGAARSARNRRPPTKRLWQFDCQTRRPVRRIRTDRCQRLRRPHRSRQEGLCQGASR